MRVFTHLHADFLRGQVDQRRVIRVIESLEHFVIQLHLGGGAGVDSLRLQLRHSQTMSVHYLLVVIVIVVVVVAGFHISKCIQTICLPVITNTPVHVSTAICFVFGKICIDGAHGHIGVDCDIRVV